MGGAWEEDIRDLVGEEGGGNKATRLINSVKVQQNTVHPIQNLLPHKERVGVELDLGPYHNPTRSRRQFVGNKFNSEVDTLDFNCPVVSREEGSNNTPNPWGVFGGLNQGTGDLDVVYDH